MDATVESIVVQAIEDLTGPVIGLEAPLVSLTGAAMLKRLSGA